MSGGRLKRILPVELGREATRAVYLLGVLGALKALTLVVLAGSLATGITSLIASTGAWQDAAVWGVAAGVARGGIGWAVQAVAARAAGATKAELRDRLLDRAFAGAALPVGSTTTLATRGLDDLDKYFGTVLPTLMNAATVPLLVGARILFADWLSALIIVLTVPLIPVFMILIGMHTRSRVDAASAALSRLSDHLVELARGLPVLVGLGRAEEQTLALRAISDDYRQRTMTTLRTAFLSSLVLELISTISVAVVAVFIGTRLVSGGLTLETGLLVLVLAPECFSPFRDLGAAFHASQDGVAAHRAVTELAAQPVGSDAGGGFETGAADAAPGRIRVSGLTILYTGRAAPAVDGLDLDVPAGSVTALTGPSGSGKSTVLAVLAGLLRRDDAVFADGTVAGVDASRVAWMPQHPRTVGDTVRDELLLYSPAAESIATVLGRLNLLWAIDADPATLSPGELRRLAFARVLLRVADGADLVLLDEPTAHLDAANAAIVARAIRGLRDRATVILASHDRALIAGAGKEVALGARRRGGDVDRVGASAVRDSDLVDGVARAGARASDRGVSTEPGDGAAAALVEVVRAAGWRFVAAVLLGALATAFAMALTAVSAWLIVRAAEHPPIMYLLVAIVGVRFFGIGRAALRYSERLLTHSAVFRAAGRLREELWRSLASRGPSVRRLLRGGETIDYLVTGVDRVRDLVPRVVTPVVVGALSALAAAITIALLHAPALGPALWLLAIGLVVAPVVALWADARASAARAATTSRMTSRFAATIAAASELRSNGVDARARRQLRALETTAERTARRSSWALGLGNAIVVAACSVTSIGMLVVAAPAIAAHELSGEVVAVLAFIPLALLEPLVGVVDAIQQAPTLRAALAKIGGVLRPLAVDARQAAAVRGSLAPLGSIEFDDLAARWPGAGERAFAGVSGKAGRGDWLVVTGPSGSGKSTLLTVLLGFLPPASGRLLLGGRDAAEIAPTVLRERVAWCPQEGHLFNSTMRANLLIARPRADAPSEGELRQALSRAGLAALVDRLPNGLDTAIGSEGSELSGGERQRLAVARTLLSRADVVLLDEPTAHLDEETATTLLADLRVALADRIVVLVTHAQGERREGDVLVALAGAVRPAVRPSAPLTSPAVSAAG